MKSFKTRLSALAMLIILLVVTVLPSFAATQPTKYSSAGNSGQRDVICTTLDGTTAAGYYTGSYTYDTLSAQSASTLLQSLRTLMTSTHKKQTSYDNCRDYATKTDCENGNGNITMIYTSYEGTYGQYQSGNGWNREHVWPKSLGGFETSGAGADLHHIRPSENQTNSNRGNKLYGNVSSGSTSKGNLSGLVGGTYSSNYYEPLDNVKGDVARICLYVYVRWGGVYSKSNNIKNVFQSVDVLLEWCALDPVDTWEMGRNEVVYAIQGNRNVFIDYPEYAWLLFGKSVPENMTTPSGKASSGNAGGGNQGGNQGGTDTPTCTHASTTVKNKVQETCGKSGYTGDTYCLECNEKLSSGTAIPATGNHSFGEWITSSSGNIATRTCGVCGRTEQKSVGSTPPEQCTHANVETRGEVPQCSEGAYSGDDYCVDCGILLAQGTPMQTLPHEYKDGELIIAPTDDKDGMQEQECIYCGEKNVRILPSHDSKNGGNGNTTVIIVASAGGGAILLAVLVLIFKRRLL